MGGGGSKGSIIGHVLRRIANIWFAFVRALVLESSGRCCIFVKFVLFPFGDVNLQLNSVVNLRIGMMLCSSVEARVFLLSWKFADICPCAQITFGDSFCSRNGEGG